MFKKLLSYIIPISIFKQKSSVSKVLEVSWANGKIVLDSQNTNYSYGNLQRILKKGLKIIGFEKIQNMKEILVLGVAGGSVIRTLVDEVNFKGHITGVEIDPEVIDIACTYFQLDQIPNLEIVIDDAAAFVVKTSKKYDLIIIDIFKDASMPDFLFDFFFINRICFLLKPRGMIMFNTMLLNEKQKTINQKYMTNFDSKKFSVSVFNKMFDTNEIIFIERK